MKNTSKKEAGIVFILTLIFAILIFVCVGRMPGGSYNFCRSDLHAQYIPFLKHFWEQILSGQSIFYSLKVSFGICSLPLYEFYGAFSPIHIFFLFIADWDLAASVCILLKLALASVCFYYYCNQVLGYKGFGAMLFSIMYGLSGYFITYYFLITALDGAYLLPLILTAVDTLIKKRRFLPLVLLYLYSFVAFFYVGYILGIFSALYYLVHMIFIYREGSLTKKQCRENVMLYLFSVLSAVLLSMIILYPTARFLFANRAEDTTVFEGLSISIFDLLGNLFLGQNQGIIGPYPMIYSGLFTLLLLPLFWKLGGIEQKKKRSFTILLLFLLVVSFVGPLYLMMHGFDNPDFLGYRFAYFYSFLFISMGLMVWENRTTFSMKYFLVLIPVAAVLYFITWQFQKGKLEEYQVSYSALGLELNLLFLVVYAFLLLRVKKDKMLQMALFITVLLELFVNGFMTLSHWKAAFNESRTILAIKEDEIHSSLDEIRAEDAGSYRVHYENSSLENASILYDFYGISYFNTFENPKVREVLYRMGYSTSPRVVMDYGSTAPMRMVFGQKYTVHGLNRGDEGAANPLWEEEPYVLPVAYLASEEIIEYTPTSDNIFENQNMLLSKLVGHPVEYWECLEVTPEIQLENMGLLHKDGQYEFGIMDANNLLGSIRYILPKEVSDEVEQLYLYTSQESSLFNRNAPYIISEYGDVGTYSNFSYIDMPHALCVGKNPNGQYEYSIICAEPTASYGKYKQMYLAAGKDEVLEEVSREILSRKVTIHEFANTRMAFSVEATKEAPYLFITVPYEKNWKAYVDGEEVTIEQAVGGTFLAIPCPEGAHEITLEYHYQEFTIGLILFAAGLVVLGGMLLIEGYRKKHEYK